MFKITLSIITALAAVFAAPALAFASVSINLQGPNPVVLTNGASYQEPGYSANSTTDGDVTGLVVTSFGGSSVSYSVMDSVGDTANTIRGIVTQSTGSLMPYCSGPNAPGWQMGVAGGGCGGTEKWVPAGVDGCWLFAVGGCVIKQ